MQPPPKLKPLRTRSENREYRRQSLIRGAICAVAHYDIHGATVDVICQHAGVSRGLIPHYFDNKEHLLSVACESSLRQAIEIKKSIASDHSLTAEQRLITLARSSFEPPIYDSEDMAAWQAFTNASRSNAIFLKAIETSGKELRGIFGPVFAQAARDAGKAIDSQSAAYGLTALLDGLWNSLTTGKDSMTPEHATKVCEQYIVDKLRP